MSKNHEQPRPGLHEFVEMSESKKVFLGLVNERVLAYLEKHYDRPEDVRCVLPYHGSRHTKRVAKDTGLILQVLERELSSLDLSHEKFLGTLAALGHDLVQQWQDARLGENQNLIVNKKRKTGFNEVASGVLLLQIINRVEQEMGLVFLDQNDKDRLQRAILVTVPAFDPKNNTVIQPNLRPGIDLFATALALADLGGPAIHGAELFLQEGNNLFREINSDITNNVLMNRTFALMVHEHMVRERILNWTQGQVQYARGRAKLLAQEIRLMPEPSWQALTELMSHWNVAKSNLEIALNRRTTMSLENLLRDVGYNIPL